MLKENISKSNLKIFNGMGRGDRRVFCYPLIRYFKPIGIRLCDLQEVVIANDEFEALRLKDLCDLDQKEAAAKMNISQPTFCRLIKAGRKKIVEALVNNKAIKMTGGNFEMSDDKIKIAICAREDNIDSKIDSFFGRAPYFVIFTIKNKKIESSEIIKNEALEQTGRAGISTAKMLVENGVKFVICENIGPRALDVLKQFDVTIFTYTGLIKNAIAAFIEDKLKDKELKL